MTSRNQGEAGREIFRSPHENLGEILDALTGLSEADKKTVLLGLTSNQRTELQGLAGLLGNIYTSSRAEVGVNRSGSKDGADDAYPDGQEE